MKSLKRNVESVLKALRKSIEFERTLNIPQFDTKIHQLQGIYFILVGMEYMQEEIEAVNKLIEELQEEKLKGELTK